MSAQEARQQQQYKAILEKLLQEPDNKVCADCRASAPRWASSKLGIFLCIKCAGIHRAMGTHISFVRSVNLDNWKENEIKTMQELGNRKAAMVYEASLPDHFRRPTAADGYALDKFIRAKYERKQFYQSKTKEQLERESAQQPVVRPAEPEVPVHHHEEQRMSGKKPQLRQPPPSSGKSNIDFGAFAAAPTTPAQPPVYKPHTQVQQPSTSPSPLLSVNLLSLDSETPDFGSYTPAAVPTSAVAPSSSGSLAPIPVANSQTTKDAIMGLFEPAPQPTYSYAQYPGYAQQAYPQAAYAQQPQAAQAYSAYYQQYPGYVQQQQQQPVQWGGLPTVDPILSKIQTISQEKQQVHHQPTGLASLLI